MKRLWARFLVVFLVLGVLVSVSFAASLELVPYTDKENGFSLSYPGDWEEEETEGFLFFAIGDNGLNVGVIKESGFGVGNASLSDFAAQEKKYLEKSLKDFEEISLKEVEVNGQKAMQRIYRYKLKVRKFESIEYYIQGKKNGFVVVYDGPMALFDELKSIADQSISTFKLIGNEAISEENKPSEPPIVGRKIEPLEEWKTFAGKEFKVDYPDSWKLSKPYEDVVFEVTSKEGYRFQILNHNLGRRGTVKGYFQGTGRWLKKHLDGYEEIEVKQLDNGYERVYKFTQNGKVNKVKELYFVKKKDDGNVYGFTLVFMAPVDKFNDAESYFRKMEESFSLNPSENATPTPEETQIPVRPTPTPEIKLPTPKPTSTPVQLPTTPPTPSTNNTNVNSSDFTLYKNAKGLFELMVPKGLSVLEEDDEYIIYGDISKGYLIAAGVGLFDEEEEKPINKEYIKEKFKKVEEEMDIEDVKTVEDVKDYKDGVWKLVETPKPPFPGMKEGTYYVAFFAKPKGNDAVALVVIVPKAEYEKYKSAIYYMIDSLK